MSHNIVPSQNPKNPGDIGRLTIAATPAGTPHGFANTMRVSRVRAGLRFITEGGHPVHIHGEDLFALREFLAELPEEEFVRPADPVKKPRFREGDLIGGEHQKFGGSALYRHNGEGFIEVPTGPGLDYPPRILTNDRAELLVEKGTLVVRYTSAR